MFSNESLVMLGNESMENQSEAFGEEMICPEISDDQSILLTDFAYWMEGVILLSIGCPGILGNALSAYILAGKSMRNSFNLLLIALAMIDNTYLFSSILESCRKRFDLQTDLHLILLPYFLYPLHSMAMTGSILMTVAIALERYNAVHWPISYSQSMNDPRALRNRVLKYLIPVFIICIVFNITKFFEIDVEYIPINSTNINNTTQSFITTGLNLTTNDNNTSFESSSVGLIEKDEMMLPLTENITNLQATNSNVSQEFRVALSITEFRKDPMYSINFNWFRFISIGVVPFLLLAYFNTQIYLDIRKQRRRKRAHNAKKFASSTGGNLVAKQAATVATTTTATEDHTEVKKPTTAKRQHFERKWRYLQRLLSRQKTSGFQAAEDKLEPQQQTEEHEILQPRKALVQAQIDVEKDQGSPVTAVTVKLIPPSIEPVKEGQLISLEMTKNGGQKSDGVSVGGNSSKVSPCSSCDCDVAVVPSATENGRAGSFPAVADSGPDDSINVVIAGAATATSTCSGMTKGMDPKPSVVEASTMVKVKVSAVNNGAQTSRRTVRNQIAKLTGGGKAEKAEKQDKDSRDSKETSLAFIMMVYVLVFLICHFPRLFLNLIELYTIRNAMACDAAGKAAFSFWSNIGVYISHVLLVINSAINILIYCCLSSKFREEGIQVMRDMFHSISCGRLFKKNPLNHNGVRGGRRSGRPNRV